MSEANQRKMSLAIENDEHFSEEEKEPTASQEGEKGESNTKMKSTKTPPSVEENEKKKEQSVNSSPKDDLEKESQNKKEIEKEVESAPKPRQEQGTTTWRLLEVERPPESDW